LTAVVTTFGSQITFSKDRNGVQYCNIEVSTILIVSHLSEGLNSQLLKKYPVSYKSWWFTIRFNRILRKRSVYFTVKHNKLSF